MFSTYTAKYTKIKSGCTGRLVEWPEAVAEGKSLSSPLNAAEQEN